LKVPLDTKQVMLETHFSANLLAGTEKIKNSPVKKNKTYIINLGKQKTKPTTTKSTK